MLSKSNMNKTREKNMLVYSFEMSEKEKVYISKLKKIVSSWKGLFSEATQNFVLIGFFNKKIDDYERRNCNKEEVIESLEKLVILCEKAEKENKIIRCRKLTVKLTNNRGER